MAGDLEIATGLRPAIVPRQDSVLRNRDYAAVLVGQAISALGNAVTLVTLPLLVILQTGSGLLMGAVGVLQTLPDLVFGPLAGVYADRWDRRRMMIAADAGRASLTALIPLAWLVGWPLIPVLLIVVGPINVLRVFFSAAENSSIPALVGRDRLSAGTGYLEAVNSLGYILGPALAGGLVAWIGPGPTLALDAASFVLSSGSIVLVRRSLRPVADETRVAGLLPQMAEGIRFAWQQPVLRQVVMLAAGFNLVTAAFVPAFTFFLVQEQDRTAGQLGLMLSIWAAGNLVGALLTARLKVRRLGLVMLGGTVTFGVAMTAAVGMASLIAFAALGFVVGGAVATMAVAYVSIRVAYTPDEFLGRVISLARTITVGMQPLGMFAGGLLIDAVGGGHTLAVMGVATVVLAAGFGVPRTLRTVAVARS